MDPSVVVLKGFEPFHHQMGFVVTPLVRLLQSEPLLMKNSSETLGTVFSMTPLTAFTICSQIHKCTDTLEH